VSDKHRNTQVSYLHPVLHSGSAFVFTPLFKINHHHLNAKRKQEVEFISLVLKRDSQKPDNQWRSPDAIEKYSISTMIDWLLERETVFFTGVQQNLISAFCVMQSLLEQSHPQIVVAICSRNLLQN
jgi:hypothetical protein